MQINIWKLLFAWLLLFHSSYLTRLLSAWVCGSWFAPQHNKDVPGVETWGWIRRHVLSEWPAPLHTPIGSGGPQLHSGPSLSWQMHVNMGNMLTSQKVRSCTDTLNMDVGCQWLKMVCISVFRKRWHKHIKTQVYTCHKLVQWVLNAKMETLSLLSNVKQTQNTWRR